MWFGVWGFRFKEYVRIWSVMASGFSFGELAQGLLCACSVNHHTPHHRHDHRHLALNPKP